MFNFLKSQRGFFILNWQDFKLSNLQYNFFV